MKQVSSFKLRNAAANLGHKTYFTGIPCARGHKSPRYTSCGTCLACLEESQVRKRQLRNITMAARGPEKVAFVYYLHPDDVPTALAMCQAVDIQRGRKPKAAPVNLSAPPETDDGRPALDRPVGVPDVQQAQAAWAREKRHHALTQKMQGLGYSYDSPETRAALAQSDLIDGSVNLSETTPHD